MERADSSQARKTGPIGEEERVKPSVPTEEPSTHPAQTKAMIYGS